MAVGSICSIPTYETSVSRCFAHFKGDFSYHEKAHATHQTTPNERWSATHPIKIKDGNERENPIRIGTAGGDVKRGSAVIPDICSQCVRHVVNL